MMTLDAFRATARRLHNLDRHMVPFLSDEKWPMFRDDPVRFLLRADDQVAAQIFHVMEQGR